MEYLKIDKGTKIDVMREMMNYTNSGKLVDSAFEFLINNEHILNDDELIKIKKVAPLMQPGQVMNWFSMDSKYYINVRKSIIVLVLFLLDVSVTRGAASLIAGLLGVTTQTIHKLDEQERCLLLDILSSSKQSLDDFLYYESECVQNDIECKYKDSSTCKRSLIEIEKRLDKLTEFGIVHIKNGIYKLAF